MQKRNKVHPDSRMAEFFMKLIIFIIILIGMFSIFGLNFWPEFFGLDYSNFIIEFKIFWWFLSFILNIISFILSIGVFILFGTIFGFIK